MESKWPPLRAYWPFIKATIGCLLFWGILFTAPHLVWSHFFPDRPDPEPPEIELAPKNLDAANKVIDKMLLREMKIRLTIEHPGRTIRFKEDDEIMDCETQNRAVHCKIKDE